MTASSSGSSPPRGRSPRGSRRSAPVLRLEEPRPHAVGLGDQPGDPLQRVELAHQHPRSAEHVLGIGLYVAQGQRRGVRVVVVGAPGSPPPSARARRVNTQNRSITESRLREAADDLEDRRDERTLRADVLDHDALRTASTLRLPRALLERRRTQWRWARWCGRGRGSADAVLTPPAFLTKRFPLHYARSGRTARACGRRCARRKKE